jgi:palmitoyl-protein thioesterase
MLNPSIPFVHSIKIGNDTVKTDTNAGFFGIIRNQVLEVCEELKLIPGLSNGFNAVGLSQGGLFLRAYVQLCDDGPRIRNLVTVGSPHFGVAEVFF